MVGKLLKGGKVVKEREGVGVCFGEGFVKGKEALSFGLTEERKFPLVFSKPRNEVGMFSLFKGDPAIFFSFIFLV